MRYVVPIFIDVQDVMPVCFHPDDRTTIKTKSINQAKIVLNLCEQLSWRDGQKKLKKKFWPLVYLFTYGETFLFSGSERNHIASLFLSGEYPQDNNAKCFLVGCPLRIHIPPLDLRCLFIKLLRRWFHVVLTVASVFNDSLFNQTCKKPFDVWRLFLLPRATNDTRRLFISGNAFITCERARNG